MASLKVLDHAVLYINPEPHRVSEYVLAPYLVTMPDDTLLCVCRHGTARESGDGLVKLHRSTDGGLTWQCMGPVLGSAEHPVGNQWAGGLAVLPDDELIVWIKIRERLDDPAGNVLLRSADGGESWSGQESIDVEPYGAIGGIGQMTGLADGALIATGEGKGDNDLVPEGSWANLITRSGDGGRSWDPVQPTLVSENPYYFDLAVTQLTNDHLLAAYWTHDMTTDRGVNVHLSTSSDLGRTWTVPRDGGFWGQRTAIFTLQSGRVLAVTNHRRPPLGIRALLSEADGTTFHEAEHVELWGVAPAVVRAAPTLAAQQDNEQDALNAWHFFTFGMPSITQLSDGTIVVAYYVTEESVTYVRCCRLRENR